MGQEIGPVSSADTWFLPDFPVKSKTTPRTTPRSNL